MLKTAADGINIGDYIEGEDADTLTEIVSDNTDTGEIIVVNDDNADNQGIPDA